MLIQAQRGNGDKAPNDSKNSFLDVMGSQQQAVAALSPGKTRYPLYKKLGGLRSRYGRTRKMSPHTWFRRQDRSAVGESLYRLSYHGRHIQSELNAVQLFKHNEEINRITADRPPEPAAYTYRCLDCPRPHVARHHDNEFTLLPRCCTSRSFTCIQW